MYVCICKYLLSIFELFVLLISFDNSLYFFMEPLKK